MANKIVHILNDGNTIPSMGFGTGTALYKKDCEDSVTLALESGFTHIDSSQMYQNEDSAGRAISKYLTIHNLPRSTIFVTTKLGRLEPGQTVREALMLALKKLQLDYVDLYLVHTPAKYEGPGQPTLRQLWEQFEQVKREGLAKSIGVSNYRIKDFEQFIDHANIKPAVHQLEFHPYIIDTAEPIIEYQRKYDITTVSYSALSPLSLFSMGPLSPILPGIRLRLSEEIGSEINDEQVLTKWQEFKGAVQLTTSSKRERLVSLLRTRTTVPDLTLEEVKAIDDAGRTVHRRAYMMHMDL